MSKLARCGSIFLLAVVLANAFLTPVLATDSPMQTVHLEVRSDLYVFVDGKRLILNTDEYPVAEYFSYQGSIYIPLHTAAELLGAEAHWNVENKTISLTSVKEMFIRERDTSNRTLSEEEQAAETALIQHGHSYGVDGKLGLEVTIQVNGEQQILSNALGNSISPIYLRDEWYLPIRSIGEWCGKWVLWLPDKPLAFNPAEEADFELLYKPYQSAGRYDAIHLITPHSTEQLAGTEEFLKEAQALYQSILDDTAAVIGKEYDTASHAIDDLKKIGVCAQSLQSLVPTQAPFFNFEASRIKNGGRDIHIYRIENYIDRLQQDGAVPAESLKGFQTYMFFSLYRLRGDLIAGEELFNQVKHLAEMEKTSSMSL